MANEVDKAPEYTLVVTERVANEKYEPTVSLTAEEFNDMRLELLSRWKAAPR